MPHVNICVHYSFVGRYDKALEESREAVAIDSSSDSARANVVAFK